MSASHPKPDRAGDREDPECVKCGKLRSSHNYFGGWGYLCHNGSNTFEARALPIEVSAGVGEPVVSSDTTDEILRAAGLSIDEVIATLEGEGEHAPEPLSQACLVAAQLLALRSKASDTTPKIDSEPNLSDLVARFSVALLEKLRAAERKYGFDDSWMLDDWRGDLARKLREHVEKGDPRDVAAYCAFAWHHGWSLAPDRLCPPGYRQTTDADGFAEDGCVPKASDTTPQAGVEEGLREALLDAYRVGFNDGGYGDWNPDTFLARREALRSTATLPRDSDMREKADG